MAADGHLGMTALSRVTLASAGLSCSYTFDCNYRTFLLHSLSVSEWPNDAVLRKEVPFEGYKNEISYLT